MTRISLSTRILILAAINILLLLGVMVAVARFEFGVGIRSSLSAPAHDRAVTVARELAFDLEETPADSRTGLMGRYGADFFLFENDGNQLAGRQIALPEEVQKALRGPGPPPQRDGERPPPRLMRRDDRPPPSIRGGGPRPEGGRGQIRIFERASLSPTAVPAFPMPN